RLDAGAGADGLGGQLAAQRHARRAAAEVGAHPRAERAARAHPPGDAGGGRQPAASPRASPPARRRLSAAPKTERPEARELRWSGSQAADPPPRLRRVRAWLLPMLFAALAGCGESGVPAAPEPPAHAETA